MSEPANGSRNERATADQSPELPAAADTIERYQTEDGTVIYDAANPMAWVYSDDAVDLPTQR